MTADEFLNSKGFINPNYVTQSRRITIELMTEYAQLYGTRKPKDYVVLRMRNPKGDLKYWLDGEPPGCNDPQFPTNEHWVMECLEKGYDIDLVAKEVIEYKILQ